MAKWGNFDFSEFERLADNLKQAVDQRIIDGFFRDFLLEMAYRAERKIKMRTPVDSGELRRNWTVGRVERQGNAYVVEINNNTEYAAFVEHGHRTGKDLTGWVEGRFMAMISMKEIEQELPVYLARRQAALLEQIMNGQRPGRGPL
ncbi:HK97 gp10 family phage protein [Paenibacillus sp. GbtcB18]|uniref:HK97 gp10 family phage protein n=1 Tax=Paenibacillus sp. GbtcB18 TaxID=2824763 RepID=UPI001C2FFAAA|nr:HK97 gp10 family phage protein [Paenibacillus sp. GbtcB18]